MIKPKWVTILSLINDNTASNISRLSNTTWSYTREIIKELEALDLITREIQGRTKKISLTKKGLLAQKSVLVIRELLKWEE